MKMKKNCKSMVIIQCKEHFFDRKLLFFGVKKCSILSCCEMKRSHLKQDKSISQWNIRINVNEDNKQTHKFVDYSSRTIMSKYCISHLNCSKERSEFWNILQDPKRDRQKKFDFVLFFIRRVAKFLLNIL